MEKKDKVIKGECIVADKDFLLFFWHCAFFIFDKKRCKIKRITKPKDLSINLALRFFSLFKPLVRLFRLYPRGSKLLKNDKIIFSFKKGVFILDINENKLKKLFTSRDYFSDVLNFCESIKSKEIAVFGEYGKNNKRLPVNIYAINTDYTVVLLRQINGIRHVHNIISDSNNCCYYVLTGDADSESKIIKFDSDFDSFSILSQGDQDSRAVVCAQNDDFIFYCTDAVEKTNHIFSLNKKTLERTILHTLDGSVIYGIQINDKLLFSTTVEPTTKVNNKLSYYLTTKNGDGIIDKYYRLYLFDTLTLSLKEITKQKKDKLPYRLFGYGYYSFANTKENCNKIVVTGHGSKKGDFQITELEFGSD